MSNMPPPPPLCELTDAIVKCTHCAERFSATKTAHDPNPIFQVSETARLCIAGQAPGLRAHNSGRPFTDPSGDRLREWLGVSDEEFYDSARIAIAPVAFCFPGYNAKNHDLPPPSDCAKIWRQKLFGQMPQVELIVTVGKSAIGWHLPDLRTKSLTDIVSGGLVEGTPSILPLPHPSWRNNAWLKGNPWFETDVLPKLRADVRRLIG